MKLKLPTFILVLIAVPVLAIGCGGGGGDDNDSGAPSADVEAATAAAQVTVTALGEQDSKALCQSLSPTFIKKQTKTVAGCVKIFRQLLGNMDKDSMAVDLGEVKLEGDRGEADLLRADGTPQGKIYLVREKGQWYPTLQAPPQPGGPTGETGKDAEAKSTDGAEGTEG